MNQVKSGTLKAKGTEHNHCGLVEKVLSHGGTGSQFWYHHTFSLQLNNGVNAWQMEAARCLLWEVPDKQGKEATMIQVVLD